MSKTFGNTVKSSKALVSSGNLTPQSRKSSAGTSIYASTVLRLVSSKTLHTYKIGTKGQLILKCLFCIFNSSKETHQKIRLYYYGTSSRIVFARFLGELKTPKRHFEIK